MPIRPSFNSPGYSSLQGFLRLASPAFYTGFREDANQRQNKLLNRARTYRPRIMTFRNSIYFLHSKSDYKGKDTGNGSWSTGDEKQTSIIKSHL